MRKWKLEEHGNQHNIGIEATRINGTGGWDDLMLPDGPTEVVAVEDVLKELKFIKDLYGDRAGASIGRVNALIAQLEKKSGGG